MGLWNKINTGIPTPNCDNCENYQKKEEKEKYEDSFTIYGKKDAKNEFSGIKILYYCVNDFEYEVCFLTRTKQKFTIAYDKEFWKKIEVNQIR